MYIFFCRTRDCEANIIIICTNYLLAYAIIGKLESAALQVRFCLLGFGLLVALFDNSVTSLVTDLCLKDTGVKRAYTIRAQTERFGNTADDTLLTNIKGHHVGVRGRTGLRGRVGTWML